jgi:hypothetical protein
MNYLAPFRGMELDMKFRKENLDSQEEDSKETKKKKVSSWVTLFQNNL